MKQIGILSDTHSYIDDRILSHLEDCDEIWHAGDIGDINVTDTIQKLPGILRAVYGNIDGSEARKEFPLNDCFSVEGIKVGMTHIAARPYKYPARVQEFLKNCRPQIFVCGHSHICLVQQNKALGILHINPGAAGKHGFHKVRTMVKLTIDAGRIENMNVIELGKR